MRPNLEAQRVPVSVNAVAGAEARARARLVRFKASGRASRIVADSEALRRNVLGVLGEQVVLLWLRSALGDDLLVRDAADSPDGPSDLEVSTPAGVLGVEVKTTTYGGWQRHGRSIPEDQLYDTDAAVYVWVAGPDSSTPTEMYIVGWSTTEAARRESSAQSYTRFRAEAERDHARPQVPRADSSFPSYDLDDLGFDGHEWSQEGSGQYDESADTDVDEYELNPNSPTVDRDPLATMLAQPAWQEGTDPRPGFGSGRAMVRVGAEVRSIRELPDWIRGWAPDS